MELAALRYELTQREQELLSEVLLKKTNAQIALDLFISENTVKFHIRNLLKKMQVHNKQEMILLIKNL